MGNKGWQIIFLVALTMLDATVAFAGCRLLGLRRDLVMRASCDCHFHMNSGRRKVLGLGAGLLPAVAAGNPKEAWAQRSFDEFYADKVRRQREPGEIKEGEMVFTFEPGIPLGIDLVEVRISEGNGGNRVAIKGIKPEGQAAEIKNIVPGLFLEVVQGQPVAGMTVNAALKLVIAEKKQRDAEGKKLTLVFSRGTGLMRYEIQEQRLKEMAKFKADLAAAQR